MAFVLKAKAEGFFYPIQLPIISDSGATQVARFEFKFKRVSRSKLNELQKMQEDLSNGEIEIDSLERDTDYIMEIADGWKHVIDDDGKDIPFGRAEVHQLLDNFPNAAGEIVKAFFESTLGGGAKRKN